MTLTIQLDPHHVQWLLGLLLSSARLQLDLNTVFSAPEFGPHREISNLLCNTMLDVFNQISDQLKGNPLCQRNSPSISTRSSSPGC